MLHSETAMGHILDFTDPGHTKSVKPELNPMSPEPEGQPMLLYISSVTSLQLEKPVNYPIAASFLAAKRKLFVSVSIPQM